MTFDQLCRYRNMADLAITHKLNPKTCSSSSLSKLTIIICLSPNV